MESKINGGASMSSENNLHEACNNQDCETIIKQEYNEDIQIKCETIEIETADNYENVQIKEEYISPNENEQHTNYEVLTSKENMNMLSFSMENIKNDVTITNVYDDNIEIKHENDIQDVMNDDDGSMDSKQAEALHNVEACLQDEIKIKLENESHEDNENNELDHLEIKNEFDSIVTETNLLINPQDGITNTQTTNTLFMEILPMNIYQGVPLGKVCNSEEILSTSYDNAMDYTDSFQLNSITGNMMSLEQEAYGLLEAKRTDKVFSCSKCPKTFKNYAYFSKIHEKYHRNIEKRELLKAKRLKMKKAKIVDEEKVVNKVVPIPNDNGYECTCGKIFQRRTRLESCLRTHKTEKELDYLLCGTCFKQFKDKEELLLHRKRMHRKIMFPCKFCPTDYKNRKELFKHLQIHQKVQVMEYKVLSEIVKGKQKLKCFMCAKTCTELSELKSHVMYDHKEPYVCPHCNGTFSKIIDFGNHTKTDHPEVEGQSVLDVLEAFSKLIKAWKCEDCDVQFHEADKLALHKIEKHSVDLKVDPQFQCIDCRRVYITLKGLMSHRRIHHITDNMEDSGMPEKGVLCIECRKVCRDIDALRSHSRLHSPNRKYPCKFCDFRFASPQKRKAHAELHTGDMKYVCFICEYRCSSENRLNQHKKSAKHLTMKNFLSSGKALGIEQSTSNTDPEKQEWMVVKGDVNDEDSNDESSNTEAMITCDICGQTFKSIYKMLKHKKTHPFIEIPNEDKPTRIFFK
ncbi:PREDICTED: zinc finger protein 271-like [Papilio xuthus]|uniref:Zinc finger protein 271-like n=1 Tax=Papilio xuthus TaxID=66420 RepID=A0AAJ7EIF8_PAPXU|nr:PREDICTED: zinc finger protein 271-like [Papilio xuthus]